MKRFQYREISKIDKIVTIIIFLLTTFLSVSGVKAWCPPGVGEHQCFCYNRTVYICSDGNSWPPGPGECVGFTCPTTTSVSKTVTSGANEKP
ncbi:MAG TPA: hypothetical protein HPP56_06405 [Nitrospirae bacterium]|nr:hypothetical protein [Nitrospirota bacterium]